MTTGASQRVLAWLFLALLVLPLHPFWLDFEQVRRGLLAVLCGTALLLLGPRLRPARGEKVFWLLIGWLALCGIAAAVSSAWFAVEGTTGSFQPWESVLRVAHYAALAVVLRLGASTGGAIAAPLATLLLATSALGLLQRLGVAEIDGYGVEAEPVSFFGNLNVAAEWTAVAAAGVAALLPQLARSRSRGIAAAALVAAGAYVVVNQSRSALIALPIALVLLFVLRRREGGHVPAALVFGGALLGLLLQAAVPLPPERTAAHDPGAAVPTDRPKPSTLEVRWEIAKGASALFAEAPVFGHGPGQFAVQYPRVRSSEEIELSSHGRAFHTEVRTVHDDWLELLVDGGFVALLLFGFAVFTLQRGQRDRARLLPLFVLLLLMLVRAPLGNAPAAAVALWLAATPAPFPPAAALRSRVPLRVLCAVLGLVLLTLGLPPIVANTLFAPYQAARARGEHPPHSAVAAAHRWLPFEPRFLQLLAQEQLFAGDLAAARRSASRAIALRPFDPQGYSLLAEILVRGQAPELAGQLVQHALRIDPAHPELHLWSSWIAMHEGDADGAIAAVVHDPHPRLAAQLGNHFRALTKAAEQRGDTQAAARFAVEAEFLEAIQLLRTSEPAAQLELGALVERLLPSMRTAGLLQRDLRFHVIAALHALRIDRPALADQLGERAGELDAALPEWQRQLLGDHLAPLKTRPAWAKALARR